MESQNAGKRYENYTMSWRIISEKVEQILKTEAKAVMTFEPLYSRIYKNVCDGFSEHLHLDLIALCSRHLSDMKQNLCSCDEFSVDHFLSVQSGLRGYLLSITIISSVFSYLNKFYVVYHLNTDLFMQLANLFSQIILSDRMTTLMDIVEESLKTPFSISPDVLYNFFNQLNQINNGEYSAKYPHLFSRYCPNVLPPMKESDIENHIKEVYDFKQSHRQYQSFEADAKGQKRQAEEPLQMKQCYHYQLQKKCPFIKYC